MRTISLILILGSVLLYIGTRDFGGGVDGGIHYAMANTLGQHLAWPFSRSSFLGTITHYPPGAHLLALGLGLIVGSTLHGIFIVTGISFVLFYVIVANLLKGPSDNRTLVNFIVFVVLIVALRKFRFVAGNEVTENFFFAQFAGNAVLIASFYFASRNLARPLWQWLIFRAIAVHLTGWFFPLSALNLALAAAVLRLDPMTDFRRNINRRLVEATLTALVLCLVAIVHPTMLDMLSISNNNGGITISDGTMVSIVLGSVIVGGLWLWVFNGLETKGTQELIALNVGALLPCLALVTFNMLGVGSLYAAKKSGFLLGTVVLMMSAVLIAEVFSRAKRTRYQGTLKATGFQMKLASCLFVVAVMAGVFAGRHQVDIGRLKAIDRDVRELLSQSAGDLYGVTILLAPAASAHVDYLIGFALLRQTGALEAQHGFFFTSKPKLDNAKFAIVDARDRDRYDSGCVMQSSESLAVVTSTCLAARLQ